MLTVTFCIQGPPRATIMGAAQELVEAGCEMVDDVLTRQGLNLAGGGAMVHGLAMTGGHYWLGGLAMANGHM